jgi:hypothetical protein
LSLSRHGEGLEVALDLVLFSVIAFDFLAHFVGIQLMGSQFSFPANHLFPVSIFAVAPLNRVLRLSVLRNFASLKALKP